LSTGGSNQPKLSSANDPRHWTNPSHRRRLFSIASSKVLVSILVATTLLPSKQLDQTFYKHQDVMNHIKQHLKTFSHEAEDKEYHATLTHVRDDGMQKWERPDKLVSDRSRYIWIRKDMSHKDAKVGSNAKLTFFKGTGGAAGGHYSGWKVKELV
jgi:hypothetical protein